MVGEYGVENSPIMKDFNSWDDICEFTQAYTVTPAFMRYRIDGWISALPKKLRAEIITKVFIAEGELNINAKTQTDGFIMVEVLDQYGNNLEKYCKKNAAFFKGDKIIDALSWFNGTIKELPSEPFKLRIELFEAEIFTLEF